MNKRQQKILFLLLTCCAIFIVHVAVSNKKVNFEKKLEENQKSLIVKTSQKDQGLEQKEQVENVQNIKINCNCEERIINASEKAIMAVVNIYASQNKVLRRYNPMNDLFKEFFGKGFGGFFDEGQNAHDGQNNLKTVPVTASGSGVILKSDGFIVTNNHVVEGAEKVEVTLHDNRKFEAKIVGTDVANDLALLKIEALGLPFLELGNSDDLNVGETIISVGNPLGRKELNSTVTKGIVSAKMRILPGDQKSNSLPSLIQTDAAMNSGCSGGAIVNMAGQLVGINVAIATTQVQQSFVGYSYGIPSNIVKRVISDIEKYGYVQKIVLGIGIVDVSDELVKEKKLKRYDGVLISSIENNSVIKKAGIQENDIITKINDLDTLCMSRLLEIIVQCDPLKPLKITVDRFGTIKNFTVQPKAPNVINISKDKDKLILQGVVFKNLDEKVKKYLLNEKIENGVQITEVSDLPWKEVVKKGYVVLSINDQPVKNIEEVKNIIASKRGTFLFDGVYLGNLNVKKCFAIRLGEDS